MNTFSERQTVLKLGQCLNQSQQKKTHRRARRRAKLAKMGRSQKERPTKKPVFFVGLLRFSAVCGLPEWAMRDSNPRLHPCKGCTLAN